MKCRPPEPSMKSFLSSVAQASWPALAAVRRRYSRVSGPWTNSFFRWLRDRRAAAVSAAIRATTNVASFTDADIAQAQLHYIEPDASNVDPANEDDLRDFAFVREPAFTAIERAFNSPDRVHLLILADSGMGKTTLLLNLFGKELRRRH